MSYGDAKAKALKIDADFNSVLDYGDAWVFFKKGDKSVSNSRIAIMKKSGQVLMFTEYLLERNTNASPKNINF